MRERRRTLRLNHVELWQPVDQAKTQQLIEPLAKRRAVPQVSARHDDMIRNSPGALLDQLEGDRLLSFHAERIDRVRDVDRGIVAQFFDQPHAVVEIPVKLTDSSTVIHRLRKLRGGDLSARDENGGLQSGARGIS